MGLDIDYFKLKALPNDFPSKFTKEMEDSFFEHKGKPENHFLMSVSKTVFDYAIAHPELSPEEVVKFFEESDSKLDEIYEADLKLLMWAKRREAQTSERYIFEKEDSYYLYDDIIKGFHQKVTEFVKNNLKFNQLNLDFILDFKFYFDTSSNKGNFTVFELENVSHLSNIDNINELFQHLKALTWIDDFECDKTNNCFVMKIAEDKFNLFTSEITDSTCYISVESIGYQRRGFSENSRFYKIIDNDNHNAETTELEKFIESVQPFLYGDSPIMQQAFRHMQKQFERNTPIQEWKLDSNGIIFFSW